MLIHMKAVQITIDEELLRRLDSDDETRKHGRSALLRRITREYLDAKRQRAIAEAYRRGYEEAPASEEELGPWLEGQQWPPE